MEIKIAIFTPEDKKRLIPREAYYESESNSILVLWQLSDQNYLKNTYSHVFGGYLVNETIYLFDLKIGSRPNIYHAIFGGEYITELCERTNHEGQVFEHSLVTKHPTSHTGENPIPIQSWDDYHELKRTLDMSTCQMLQNFTDSSYNRSTAMSDCFEYMQKIAPQESSNSLDNEENWYDQYYPDVPSEVSEYEAHMQRYEESKSHAPHSFTSEELSMMPPNMGAYRLYYELKLQTDPNFSSSVSMTNNSQPSFERSSGRQKESKKSPEKWSFCTLL